MFQNVGGTGVIECHFLLYTDDCDEDWPFSKCDPLFTFCLSTPQRGRLTATNCNYASTSESKDVFGDTNYIDMSRLTNIGGLVNPWVVTIPRFIEQSVSLVIRVVDADIGNDDHMQTFGTVLTETVWPSKEVSQWQERVMSQNSYTMRFKVRMYCDTYYYTTTCDKYCKPQDASDGHYTCHPDTGDRICLPGWQGSLCTQDIDECALGYCVRGTCTNIPGDYICNCPPNYAGKNCSSLLNPCRYKPCQNGGTCFAHPSDHVYICICTPEWEGTNCESPKTACRTNTCLNNGTCVSSPGGTNYTCTCAAPYSGVHCETAPATTALPNVETETTSSKPSSSSLGTENTSTPEDSQGANVRHLVQEEDKGGFQYWYIAIIVAVLLIIAIVLAVLLVRRRKSKAAKSLPQSGPIITFIGQDLSFDNGTYATVNRNNSENERQTRQLPPVPGLHTKEDPVKNTYAVVNENEGATGGSKTDDSGFKKSTSDSKKTGDPAFGSLTSPANERAQTNHYADFKSLRDSQAMMDKPDESHQEEVAYHDLDDISAQMQGDNDPHDSDDGTFSYIIPDTPIVTVQTSPYDSPSNNASYYDSPKSNLPSPLVPKEEYAQLTPSDDTASNEFSPYVNAPDSDSNDDEDILQEDILKLRKDVEDSIPSYSKS
ncbi:hypothetical protein BsWGS_11312 [Bradybaena similaris]